MESLPPPIDELTAIAAGPPPKRRGLVWTSWAVILLAVVAIIAVRMWPTQAVEAGDAKPNKILELQARIQIGMFRLLGPLMPNAYEQAKQLNRGDLDQRLSFIVIAGEIAGPAEATQHLATLNQQLAKSGVALTDSQKRVREILQLLYADYERGVYPTKSITAEQRAFLIERLGWLGELALHPQPRLPAVVEQAAPIAGAAIPIAGRKLPEMEGRAEVLHPAKVTAIAALCGVTVGLLAAVIGLIGAFGFVLQSLLGGITWRLHTGIAHGGVYAETFAIWLLLFFGMNVSLSLLELPRLTGALIVMPSSLLALGWPLLRGVSFTQMRQDIGLKCESNFLVEIAAGVWCYVINLPLVILGLLITVGLMRLQGIGVVPDENAPVDAAPDFSTDPMPSHPVVHMVAEADGFLIAQIFLLASVFAPIVEEIMFRGVLHRHCRELTGHWPRFWSALASTTIVSFIFAAVHPQGLAVIPPLMFMAFGFSLAREWRESLLPSMFAHGMSNGAVLTVATFALSR
jgi:membrane protease YdiL (CAAX protease family)